MIIRLKIKFSRLPSQEESGDLWATFIQLIEEMHLYAGGSSDSERLRWYIDTSYTELSLGVIIDQLSGFLSGKKDYIQTYKFIIKHKLGDPLPGEDPQPYLPGCSM